MNGSAHQPVAHLIHGYLAAGKTTFARRLSVETGAILLSDDEWYLHLYTDGTPTEHLDDVLYRRLRSQLDELWPQLLTRGVDVVLDFGFWRRADRDRARALATKASAAPVLYNVVCDEKTARRRLAERNADPAGSFLLQGAAYDHLRTKFEDLGDDEAYAVVETSHD